MPREGLAPGLQPPNQPTVGDCVTSSSLERESDPDAVNGGLPAATGRKMHFTGTTVLKVVNGKIVEERGLDDGGTALTQLGQLKPA